MKVAVIGSRNLILNNLEEYLPADTTEIVSGGAAGIDTCAKNFALKHNYLLREFLPDYSKYGRRAPLLRNLKIIEYSDLVLAFWDGKSRGTKFVIDHCKKQGRQIKVILIKNPFRSP